MKRIFLIVLDSFGIGQMPDGEKAKYADIIINNGGNMDELKAIVSDLYAERKYGKKEKKTQEQ